MEWRQESITLFGKRVLQPRLIAWYSDPGVSYRYSGLTLQGQGWPEFLLKIKNKVETQTQQTFNGVLLNHYRDGSDSMGWHRDNEKELGPEPLVASLSFGETRRFLLRDYENKEPKIEIPLSSGDLLLMAGEIQSVWEHSLPKQKRVTGPRINLTFRQIVVNPILIKANQ